MKNNKRTTLAVTIERKLMLERIAIDASQKAGKQITWTDIVNYMIDNHAEDAAGDLIERAKNSI